MPAVDCCVQLIHSIMRTVLWTKYLVIRAAGSDERRELTHAVMRELDAPDNWT
ncbi:hypothetical protein CCT89_004936, partial [Escherichia coli]|nr:hypothetical protein [Escherichia coli]